MKKRILGGLTALVCAATLTVSAFAEAPEQKFGYSFDAMTIPTPVNVIVPANVTAYLNPYGTTVAFDRNTLARNDNAEGKDRLELSGDIISPTYTITNVGSEPVRVYVGVSGTPLGKATLVDPSTDVSVWSGSEQNRGVNLWVTGGLDEAAVDTTTYNIAKSVAITKTESTRTLIEYLDGSTKGYFKINGRLNKYAKGWGETDGVHINFALKIVPIDA